MCICYLVYICHRHSYRQFFECLYLQAAAGEICYQPSVSLRQLRTQVRGSGYDTCSKLFLAAAAGACYCNAAYSARYMLVELLTGILFALCGLYYLPGLKIILVFFFVACLIVQAFIDLDHQILLDEILMLMLPTGIIYAYYALPDMWDSLYGALFAGGLMLLIFLLSRGGMGAGDVKLSFVLGVWLGFKASIVCLMLAFVFGGINCGVLAAGFRYQAA